MITKRKQYQQSIRMTEDETYTLLMETAHEAGFEAVQYIENKLKEMSAGVSGLGLKGAALIVVNACAKGYWPDENR